MKILFNLTDPEISSDELKELLGYVDADISFKNLLPDIITATKDVKKLISTEVYNYAFESYTTGLVEGVYTNNFDSVDSNIVRSIRYPIAVNAYRLFAPTNDLSHSNDGRTTRGGENTKVPWQWQIDNDNKAQEQRYYRALDDLIDLLDDSMPDDYESLTEEQQQATVYYKWINSTSYKAVKNSLLNNVDDFNNFFQIESRLLLMKITPGIIECERREIIPRIGKDKYIILKDTPTEAIDIELLNLVKMACACYSLAWAIPRLSVSIFPEGILQYQVSDRQSTISKKPALLNEHELARQAFSETLKQTLIEIENLVAPVPEVVEPAPEPTPIINCDDKFFSAT
ncbi:DUF6712 family protein [Flavobacterium sp. HNIBRBA15423]|uniref:DUF6712 family protein n=1 Tax=Flavobacterium sp. HNIBRBA15423 TaxID=3458683 RepID=UPI00404419F9